MDSHNAEMVERHTETQPDPIAPPVGCRTLCQHPGCEIEQCIGTDEWVHIDSAQPDHWATPAESPEHSAGQQLVASVEASVAAYQRGRREGLEHFARHLRGIAQRGVNERITESLLSIADIAEREAAGEPPVRYCPDSKTNADDHYPCGEIDCGCSCQAEDRNTTNKH